MNLKNITLYRKRYRYLTFMFLGLYLFYMGHLLHDYVLIEVKWTRLFNIVGELLFFLGFLLAPKNMRGVDKNIAVVYRVFAYVVIANLIIGIPIVIFLGNYRDLLFSDMTIGMYLIGLCFFIPTKFDTIGLIINWSCVFLVTSVIFAIYCFNDFFVNPEQVIDPYGDYSSFSMYVTSRPQEPGILLAPISFFLIFYKKFHIIWKWLIPIAFVLSLLASLFAGRRSSSVAILGYFLIPVILYLRHRGWSFFKTAIPFLLIFSLCVNKASTNKLTYFLEDTFTILTNRLESDTRSGVEEDFYKDMTNPIDWIIGRGMNGTYYSPQLAFLDRPHRNVVETGFLNIILHGGFLMLVPYVLLLLYSFFKGCFFSNNEFIQSCALLCLMYLAMLYPGGSPKLTFNFFILFAFIRLCTSFQWRNMTDREIETNVFKIK